MNLYARSLAHFDVQLYFIESTGKEKHKHFTWVIQSFIKRE